jgi:hypothetical protein
MRQPRMMAGPNDRWDTRLHLGSSGPISTLYGINGGLSYVRPEGATHTMCWSGCSPVGCKPIRIAVTLLDISDCLLIPVIS